MSHTTFPEHLYIPVGHNLILDLYNRVVQTLFLGVRPGMPDARFHGRPKQ
jgi:hypothetical protein